jgi:hypothetical protein
VSSPSAFPLLRWPTDIALLALHLWDRFAELLTVEMPGLDPPRHPRAFPSNDLGARPLHKVGSHD